MVLVILLYPDGQRRQVVLEAIPMKGDEILLRGETQRLHVEHRLHMEANNGKEPSTLISVRPVP